ncbi:DNA-directed DNA/RNA polymerase mu-like isoform X2 [Myxocyprinus asiaticus]|uniref:DNA-directed DNA/RNA polymerase mu-like isoform X2 n=1 Tax=Myxocyprinus asiaticus TaxID=70543 RepID=UPI002221AEBB|nr:DNA-directed DNA/RNA polymerase mu-like isoform X2 [Myxocyprinus asiaticus]
MKLVNFPMCQFSFWRGRWGHLEEHSLHDWHEAKDFSLKKNTENNSGDDVQAWLDNQSGGDTSTSVHLLDISWFTESMEAGRPVTVQDKHRLKVNPKPNGDAKIILMKSYACQRRTPLKHHNVFLTEALELLAENAEFSENEGRSVAFRRAASVLKALPCRVHSVDELKCLPWLGEHSQRVIKEILEDGTSREVETTRQCEQFQAMKALTGIFGVGVRTADRWLREGLRSPSDLIQMGQQLNRAQQAGVQYYNDLQKPVTKAEAEVISDIVQEAVHTVLPGAEIQLMGGFKRGKEVGHDVDFLITHPEEGKEEGLIAKIINWLEEKGLLLYQKTTRNTYLEQMDGPARPLNNMDQFERCFSIFKLQRFAESTESEAERSVKQSEASSWRAVRVDLVVSPYSQFAFATLGWTGSKLFERELRRWAGQEKHMSLNSHALYDSNQESDAHTNLELVWILHSWLCPPLRPLQHNACSHSRAANSPIRDERGSMRTIKGPHCWGPLH